MWNSRNSLPWLVALIVFGTGCFAFHMAYLQLIENTPLSRLSSTSQPFEPSFVGLFVWAGIGTVCFFASLFTAAAIGDRWMRRRRERNQRGFPLD